MKKNYSIKLTILLSTLCVMNLPQSTLGASFNDTSNHWAKEAINRIGNFELISGFNGSFRPNEPITRGELSVILNKVMAYQNKSENIYTDLDNNFYTDSILKLTKANIISGYDNKVRPKDYITREEASVLIARTFDVTSDKNGLSFKDTSKISSWAMPSVNALVQEGIIKGSNGEFRPKDNITRAEVVTILNNILGGYYKKAGKFSKEDTSKSVVVSASDVTLQDMTIEKDLIIAAGVGEGDVTLSNVNVKGKTLIYGGGKHSVHIEGNSSLNTVSISKEGSPIRIVTKDNANVNNVILNEQNADTILEGNMNNVQSLSSNKSLEVRGNINNLSLNGNNTNLNLTQNAKVENVSISSSSVNNNFNLAKGTNINNIQTYSNLNIKGEGNITSITPLANNVSISKPDSMKTDIKNSSVNSANKPSNNQSNQNVSSTVGVSGPSYGSGGSASSGGNIGGGNIGGNNNNNNTNISKPKIISVESVQNGLVRFKLDKKFDGNLTKSMLSIICTSGGNDMTILDVKTSDNITFDVTTAYYKDGSYSLAIIYPNNTLTEKSFEVRTLAPVITQEKVQRKSPSKANVTYRSDTAGTLYYILKENPKAVLNEKTRNIVKGESISLASDITEDEIVKNGKHSEMKSGGNVLELNNLTKDTSYTMYYVAEDLSGNRTFVKQLQITDKAEGTESSVDILEAEGFFNDKAEELYAENYWFDFRLNAPVELELKDFTISCPKGNLKLGRLEKIDGDSSKYRVYLEKGYLPYSDVNFTVKIDLPDGTTISKTFFTDYQEPNITGVSIKRTSEQKVKVSFTSDEDGKLYWQNKRYSEISQDTKPKDPNEIISGGKFVDIHRGGNSFELDIQKSDEEERFCFVSQDAKGNKMHYYDYLTKIPKDVEQEEVIPEEQKLKLTVVDVNDTEGFPPGSSVVKFKIDGGVMNNEGVEIESSTGQTYRHPKQIVGVSYEDSNTTVVLELNSKLPNGEYTLKLDSSGKKGLVKFNVPFRRE